MTDFIRGQRKERSKIQSITGSYYHIRWTQRTSQEVSLLAERCWVWSKLSKAFTEWGTRRVSGEPFLCILHVVVNWQWPQWLSYREKDLWPLDLIVDYSIQWAHDGFHVIESRHPRHFPLQRIVHIHPSLFPTPQWTPSGVWHQSSINLLLPGLPMALGPYQTWPLGSVSPTVPIYHLDTP